MVMVFVMKTMFFVNNGFEWLDSDDDGVEDNSDVFPNDPNETMDSDNDDEEIIEGCIPK